MKDGGPAFPNITPDMPVDGGPGMSLRDWFAGMAMQGMLSNSLMRISSNPEAALTAYSIADAMIVQRERGEEGVRS